MIVTVATALALIATVINARGWVRDPGNGSARSLTVTLAALTLSLAVEISPFYHWLGSVTGVQDIGRVIVHAFTLAYSTSTAALVVHWAATNQADARRAERRRWNAFSAVVVVLVVLFLLDPTSREKVDIAHRYQHPNGWLTAYSVVYYSAWGASMVDIWRRAWRYSLRLTNLTAAGIWCLGTAALIATVYCLHQAVVIVLGLLKVVPPWPNAVTGNSMTLAAVVMLLIAVCLRTIGARIARIKPIAGWLQRRDAARIEPLLIALAARFKQISFDPDDDADPDLVLYRRAVATSEGLVRIAPFLSPEVEVETRRAARWVPPRRRARVILATRIAVALQAAKDGVRYGDTEAPAVTPKEEFPDEAHRLAALSSVFAKSRIVKRLEARFEPTEAPAHA